MTDQHEGFSRFIDSEISRLRAEQERPGWTKWALLAAFGTSVWALLTDDKLLTLNPALISQLLLGLSVLVSAVSALDTLLAPWGTTPPNARFLTINPFARHLRRLMLLEIVKVSVICIGTYLTIPFFSGIGTFSAIAFAAYHVLAVAATVLISFLQIHFPANLPKKPYHIATLLFSFVSLATVSLLLAELLPILLSHLEDSNILPYVRISLTLAAIFWIASQYLGLSFTNPFLVSLEDTKRMLAFGEIGIEEAKRRSDLALRGSTISEILKSPLEAILAVDAEMMRTYERGRILAEAAIAALKPKRLTSVALQTASAHLESIIDLQQQAQSKIQSRDPLVTQLHKRVTLLSRLAPHARDELTSIYPTLMASLSQIQAKRQELGNQLTQLESIFQRRGLTRPPALQAARPPAKERHS